MTDHEKGYGKRPLWQWVAIYFVIAAVLYGGYYFIFAKKTITLAGDWPVANQNFSNTRSAVGSSIRSTTIAKLAPSWSLPIVGLSEWGAATTNPVILGNIVYFQDLESNIYAVDFVTGKQLWMKKYNLQISGPNGVAVGYGKIYAQKGHYDVVALDLKGNEIWDKKISDNQNVGVDIQLTVYGNMVYAATVPGITNSNFYKGGGVGVVYALDARSEERRVGKEC